MDEDTLLQHKALWVNESAQHPATELTLLTEQEQQLYRDLKQQRWGQNVRLEQERIDWRSQIMRYSSQVKPISYLKANAAEVLAQLTERREPLVITQNREAKAVIQDVASYEETQETLALLKILALGNAEIEAGKVKPVGEVVARLRAKQAAK